MASIKLTNSVMIASKSTELHAIDETNVLASKQSFNGTYTYTAAQDCYMSAFLYQVNSVYVNDVNYIGATFENYPNIYVLIPLKTGDVCKMIIQSSYAVSRAKVFGVK